MGVVNGKFQTAATKSCANCGIGLRNEDDHKNNLCWACATDEIRDRLRIIHREPVTEECRQCFQYSMNRLKECNERIVDYVSCEKELKLLCLDIDEARSNLLFLIEYVKRNADWLGKDKVELFNKKVKELAYGRYDDDDKKIIAKHKEHTQKYLIWDLADLVTECATMEKWNTWPTNIVPSRDSPQEIVNRAKKYLLFLITARKQLHAKLIKLGVDRRHLSLERPFSRWPTHSIFGQGLIWRRVFRPKA